MRTRKYGPQIEGAAMRVLVRLLDQATRGSESNPFVEQAALRPIAFPERYVNGLLRQGSRPPSASLMSDVMTCAALNASNFQEGSSLFGPCDRGYVLIDAASSAELRTVRGRANKGATALKRTVIELRAMANGPLAKEVAREFERAVDVFVDPALEMLETLLD